MSQRDITELRRRIKLYLANDIPNSAVEEHLVLIFQKYDDDFLGGRTPNKNDIAISKLLKKLRRQDFSDSLGPMFDIIKDVRCSARSDSDT